MANFPGTTGDDVYAGTPDTDNIFDGGGGNDSLAGAGGDDFINVTGGAGNVDGGTQSSLGDILLVDYAAQTGDFAMTGGNLISNGAGTSVSYTGIERFRITTGGGNDTLFGGAGGNVLNAGRATIVWSRAEAG